MQLYADQAMAMLHDAVAKGFKNAAHMKKDADLDPLRQREDSRSCWRSWRRKGSEPHACSFAPARP